MGASYSIYSGKDGWSARPSFRLSPCSQSSLKPIALTNHVEESAGEVRTRPIAGWDLDGLRELLVAASAHD